MIYLKESIYKNLSNEMAGICIGCYAVNYGVEPDARRYECELCGESKVYGIDELLIYGAITIMDEIDEKDAYVRIKNKTTGEITEKAIEF